MNIKFDETIWKCMDSLRRYFAYEDCNKILIYVVFLKYIIDNKKIPLNSETFNLFLDAQRMMDKGELEKDIVTNLNYTIENYFDIVSGSLTEFSNLYFRVVELKQSKRTSILEQLNDVSFENESDAIIDSLKTMLWENASSFGRMMGDEVSNKSLSRLVREILILKENEEFADFTYGLGLSSLEITKDVPCKLIGYDTNKQTSTMAQMLLIICGNDNFKIHNENVITANIAQSSCDKIAIFPPLGVKVRELDSGIGDLLQEFGLPDKSANLEVLIALQGLKSLKDDGKMILSVTPSMLFSATAVEKRFRELITNNYLSAVITLPSLHYGTNVATNLIVLEKNRNTEEVMFIDASSNEYFPFINKDKKNQNQLSYEAIDKITITVRDKQIIEGISSSCSADEIKKNDFSLAPSRYVQVKRKRETVSNKEIDKRLQQLYAEIKQLIN